MPSAYKPCRQTARLGVCQPGLLRFFKGLVEAEGMLLMHWSYGYDWEKQYSEAEALADIMVNTEFLRNGANLLMHDRAWTAQALPAIIEGLKNKGYGFIDPADIERAGK